MKKILFGLLSFLLLLAVPCWSVPILVQRASGPNNLAASYYSNNPSTYTARLPDGTQAHNCIIVVTTNDSHATPTVTDDQGNNYLTGKQETDTNNGQQLNIFYAMDVVANTRVITVSAAWAGLPYEAVHVYEFAHIATTAALDTGVGNFGSNTSPHSVTAGASGTLGATGDLVIMGMDTDGPVGATGYTAGSQSNITWQLGTADRPDGMATQWGIYNSTATLNPTMSFTSGGTGAWVAAAAFFKTDDTKGSARPAGIRIAGILHQSCGNVTNTGGNSCGDSSPATLSVPIFGNAVVIASGVGQGYITSVSDSHTNSWSCNTSYDGTLGDSAVQFCYSFGGTYDAAMTITVTLGVVSKDYTFMIYDIAGAPTSGTFYNAATLATTSATQSANTASLDGAVVTPAAANGLIIGMMAVARNTINSATQTFDSFLTNNEGLDGPQNIDENNGWAHIYNGASLSPITFHFGFVASGSNPPGVWVSMGAEFNPPPAAGASATVVLIE